MKLLMIFLTAACMSASARGDAQVITYSAKDAPIEQVFTAIKKQTDYVFFYRNDDVAKARPVTIDLKNTPVEKALQEVFKGQPLSYSIVEKTIVVKQKIQIADIDISSSIEDVAEQAPPIDVHGRIVDETGKPVVVTVMVKGTKRGVSTNENGEFELKGIADNATLIVTGVGIERFEIRVNGKPDLGIINSKTKVSSTEEVKVINTGYQRLTPEKFVGSYSQLDSTGFHRREGMKIIERLNGTVNGVLFDEKGGGVPLQIRGISSLGYLSFEPLIIIDNFPYNGQWQDLEKVLNPNDVESINILKDAAAASLPGGTRGGNGVIVITTKKGRFNQPFSLSLHSSITLQEKPDLYYFPQMTSSDYVDVEQFLFNKGAYNSNLTSTLRPVVSPVVEILDKLKRGLISKTEADEQINFYRSYDTRKDLDKYVYKSGFANQNYLTISGGNNILGYSISGGYSTNTPNIQGLKTSSRYTINSNTTVRPLKNLEFSTGINFNSSTDYVSAGGSGGGVAFPYIPLADASGNHLAVPYKYRTSYIDTAGGGKLLDWHYVPLDESKLQDNTIKSQSILLNFSASYKFTSWLSGQLSYQFSQQRGDGRNYQSQETFFTRDQINLFTQLNSNGTITRPIPLGGILEASSNTAKSNNGRAQLNFVKNWGGKHTVNGIIAGDISENKSESHSQRFYGYNENNASYFAGIDYLKDYTIWDGLPGSSRIQYVNSISEGALNRFVGLSANASYTYSDRYNFYISARRDAANIFGVSTNNKWKPLWSTGAKWDVSKESFYKISWMTNLSIRATYGYTGNVDNTHSGLPSILYNSNTSNINNLNYAVVSEPPNKNLRWAQNRTINIGADFGLFSNRISGGIEWYTKNSDDLLANTQIDPTLGVNTFVVNFASLKSHGLEIKLNSENLKGRIRWNTGFGLSYNKTIVTKYYNGGFRASQFIGYSINPSVGNIAFGISSYRFAGLDPATGEPLGILNKQVTRNYNAIANDSLNNQIFNGSLIPLIQGYFSNGFSWKNISVSANIVYRLKYFFRKPTISYSTLFNSGAGHPDYLLRWQKPGDESKTTVPAMIYPVPDGMDQFYANSEVNVLKGDHIRLQGISMNYNWVNKNLTRLPIKSIGLNIYTNLNIILWRANQSNLDPDFTGGQSIIQLPPSKLWTAGITVNF